MASPWSRHKAPAHTLLTGSPARPGQRAVDEKAPSLCRRRVGCSQSHPDVLGMPGSVRAWSASLSSGLEASFGTEAKLTVQQGCAPYPPGTPETFLHAA